MTRREAIARAGRAAADGVHVLTPEQFDSLTQCMLRAIEETEGWDPEREEDGHPSWKRGTGSAATFAEPSRKLVANMRFWLPRHFRVLPKPRKA